MKPRSVGRMAVALVLALGLTGAFAAIAMATETTLPDPTQSVAMIAADRTITSDQADYAPGSLVTLTGANWQGDSTVRIRVDDNVGNWWLESDPSVDVQADGTFTYSFNLPT